MPRHRSSLMLRTKRSVQHGDTLLSNIGSGSVPTTFEVLETEGGARTLTGASQTIQSSASTGEVVRVGDTVKYINLFFEIAARAITAATDVGWLEWAFVCVKESETTVPITTVGTQTLGIICTNMFRNECIFTGCIPVGLNQSNCTTIKLKIPKFKQVIRLGDEWRFVCYFRSNNSADVQTASHRLVQSFMYKTYS